MSARAGDLLYTCLLFLCAFAFVCVHGRGLGLNPPCEVALLVKHGTHLEAAPGQRLSLKCPVEHCGDPVKVLWCKEHDKCVDIFPTDNVEITQDRSSDRRLTAFLNFKRVSPEDTGLYRCYIDEGQSEGISNAIKVVVSGLNPPCDVALLVKHGTHLEAAPGQRLTLECPVEHCGDPVKVLWCKEHDKCVDIFPMDNMEIIQASSSDRRLTALLNFKRVSPEDAGLYRCYIDEGQSEGVSHAIKVVVSGESPDPSTDDDVSWLPFFFIGLGIAALVGIVIVSPVIKGRCQKRTMTFNPAHRQDMSINTIPDLPPRGPAPTFVQQHQPIFLSSFERMPTPQLNVNVDAHRHEGVVYSGINHQFTAPTGGYFH
ncbi:CD226 antigen-like isoform X2 [Nelusetta ayraudi]|uniref:CD226 antigen-like isoform X2 n=1 Tax=Nelusetta ayraudi TaxID=303726 RepID=UPI003F6EFF38